VEARNLRDDLRRVSFRSIDDSGLNRAGMRAQRSSQHLYFIALAGGALLWLATMAVTGRREAWDAPLYWSVTYPLCIALAAFLAYVEPVRAWRWALAIMLVQPVVMALTSGSSWNLMPIGLVLFGILALPPMLAARIAAWFRLRQVAR
jgi:hypothetical protein